MEDRLKNAKENHDKAYAEFAKANLKFTQAVTKQEKEEAEIQLKIALANFDEAHRIYVQLQLASH